MTVLITGPVRSGKSDYAKRLALERDGPVFFIATAAVDPSDHEFAARVERHKRDRPAHWTTIELGTEGALVEAIARTPDGATVIVDSLGTWLSGHLVHLEELAELEPAEALLRIEATGKAFLDFVVSSRRDLILISEETGWSLVPTTPLGRVFTDALGRLNRALAAAADAAYLVVAGYALDLKMGRSV